MPSRWGKNKYLSFTELATVLACNRINPERAKRKAEQKSKRRWKRNQYLSRDRMLKKVRLVVPILVRYLKSQLQEHGEVDLPKIGKLKVVPVTHAVGKNWMPNRKQILLGFTRRKKVVLEADPLLLEYLNQNVV